MDLYILQITNISNKPSTNAIYSEVTSMSSTSNNNQMTISSSTNTTTTSSSINTTTTVSATSLSLLHYLITYATAACRSCGTSVSIAPTISLPLTFKTF